LCPPCQVEYLAGTLAWAFRTGTFLALGNNEQSL
jgi:hypothetical protein